MKNCQTCNELLNLHLEGALSAEQGAEFARHLAENPECAREADLQQNMVTSLRSIGLAPAPSVLRTNVRAQLETLKQRPGAMDMLTDWLLARRNLFAWSGSLTVAAALLVLVSRPMYERQMYSPGEVMTGRQALPEPSSNVADEATSASPDSGTRKPAGRSPQLRAKSPADSTGKPGTSPPAARKLVPTESHNIGQGKGARPSGAPVSPHSSQPQPAVPRVALPAAPRQGQIPPESPAAPSALSGDKPLSAPPHPGSAVGRPRPNRSTAGTPGNSARPRAQGQAPGGFPQAEAASSQTTPSPKKQLAKGGPTSPPGDATSPAISAALPAVASPEAARAEAIAPQTVAPPAAGFTAPAPVPAPAAPSAAMAPALRGGDGMPAAAGQSLFMARALPIRVRLVPGAPPQAADNAMAPQGTNRLGALESQRESAEQPDNRLRFRGESGRAEGAGQESEKARVAPPVADMPLVGSLMRRQPAPKAATRSAEPEKAVRQDQPGLAAKGQAPAKPGAQFGQRYFAAPTAPVSGTRTLEIVSELTGTFKITVLDRETNSTRELPRTETRVHLNSGKPFLLPLDLPAGFSGTLLIVVEQMEAPKESGSTFVQEIRVPE